MNEFFLSPIMVPIAGMVMVCVIVAIRSKRRSDDKETELRHALRLKEMEHEQKMKEMELELAKLGAAKGSVGS